MAETATLNTVAERFMTLHEFIPAARLKLTDEQAQKIDEADKDVAAQFKDKFQDAGPAQARIQALVNERRVAGVKSGQLLFQQSQSVAHVIENDVVASVAADDEAVDGTGDWIGSRFGMPVIGACDPSQRKKKPETWPDLAPRSSGEEDSLSA